LKKEGIKDVVKIHQAERLMVDYLHHNPKFTPATRVSAKNAIKSFYSANWFSLEPASGEDITQPEPKKRCPTMQDLKELEDSMNMQKRQSSTMVSCKCTTKSWHT
jgi:hypothetical protein